MDAIPEESAPMLFATDDDDVDVQYMLDLGSGSATHSGCVTPLVMPASPPPFCATTTTTTPDLRRRVPRRTTSRDKDAERECGICFELAAAPVRTQCCSHIFCAEHILAWLEGPSSDGRCPSCRAPSSATGLLALGHPAQLHLVPPPPPPSRSPSPRVDPLDNKIVVGAGTYASYPSVPVPSSPVMLSPVSPRSASSVSSASSCTSPSSSSSSSSEEDEDTTDYSLPALVRARGLQTRRHVPHPMASVLGLRGVCVSLIRALVCVLVIGVLAGRGRWAVDEGVQGEAEAQAEPSVEWY
ncbi:hypothetical protein FB45DRAFT_149971 [Roridomyces roridus]|uniref:RING-type domain-containing protein n=1 Tax=Roridomyces roridus TaxID=1738132 RepID=A0AAD7FF42_9AGAR|nr:hypothetical protein FB45DRAFT_149971 [Roridomyces roridus]